MIQQIPPSVLTESHQPTNILSRGNNPGIHSGLPNTAGFPVNREMGCTLYAKLLSIGKLDFVGHCRKSCLSQNSDFAENPACREKLAETEAYHSCCMQSSLVFPHVSVDIVNKRML